MEKTLPINCPPRDCADCQLCTAQSALEMMPSDREIQTLAETFKIFGDPTRMRIIFALFMGEMCVDHLSKSLDMSQSAVSHQLRQLRNNYLVKTRRVGKNVYYSLDDDHVYSIINQGLMHVRHRHEEDNHG